VNFYTFNFNFQNKNIIVFVILFVFGISFKFAYDIHYYLKNKNTLNYLSNKYNKSSKLLKVEDFLPLIYENNKCFRYKLNIGHKLFVDNECLLIKNSKKPTLFLIGDSHSASIGIAMSKYYKNNDINFLQISSGWCSPFTNNKDNKECSMINTLIDRTVNIAQPDILIISLSWLGASKPPYNVNNQNFFDLVKRKLEIYKQLGAKDILLIGQLPVWTKMVPDINLFSSTSLNKEYSVVNQEITDIDHKMLKFSYDNNTTYISLISDLCINNECLIKLPNSNELMSWDESHLTEDGSNYIFLNYLLNKIHINN